MGETFRYFSNQLRTAKKAKKTKKDKREKVRAARDERRADAGRAARDE